MPGIVSQFMCGGRRRFFNRRNVVEAYLRTEDVHHDVARRFAAERLSLSNRW
jgi:hypothetical protein